MAKKIIPNDAGINFAHKNKCSVTPEQAYDIQKHCMCGCKGIFVTDDTGKELYLEPKHFNEVINAWVIGQD